MEVGVMRAAFLDFLRVFEVMGVFHITSIILDKLAYGGARLSIFL